MQIGRWMMWVTGLGLTLSGCATVVLAPGAEQVKLTRAAADVASCQVVGSVSTVPNGLPANWDRDLQNKAFGMGGNVLFITSVSADTDGVAYHCP
jgi:hypothetical protein